MKRIIQSALACACLLLPGMGWAAIAWDASSNNRGTTVSSVTLSHVVGGSDRILVCGYAVADASPQPVTGATYNGVAMTRLDVEVAPDGVFLYAGAFYLIAPATGTHNAVISTAGGTNGRFFAACTSYTGVHQTVPFGTAVEAHGGTQASPITSDVTSAAGELVIDIMAMYSNSAPGSEGAGQTKRAEDYNGGNGDQVAMSEEAGAGTVTMSWTYASGTPAYYHISVPLKPVAAASGASSSLLLMGVGQ